MGSAGVNILPPHNTVATKSSVTTLKFQLYINVLRAVLRQMHVVMIAVLLLQTAVAISPAHGAGNVPPVNTNLKNNTGAGERMVQRIITEEDNGREIEVFVGDIIRVDLRFHGGSGYSWYPDLPDSGSLQLIDSRGIDLSEPGMVGGPGMGMWYFKVLKPGNTRLDMLHYRVWEGPKSATKTFNVKLQVIERRR
jgi:predicted secreted protein